MDRVVNLVNQNQLHITGVEKVKNVTPNEIIAVVDSQLLIINGQNMEVQNLDIENSNLTINGSIECIKYTTKKPNLIKRIFK